MILLLSFDVRRRGGIERLSLQVKRSLEGRGERVVLLCPQRLGPGPLGRLLGRLRFVGALAWWLPQAQQVLSMHALLLRSVRWLRPLRPRHQHLWCWLHGIEVWGTALAAVRKDLQHCTGLIASSRFTRDQVLAQTGAWPPIQVVHPMGDLIDASRSPNPLPNDLRLLTVARMDATERYKGHRLILRALKRLMKAKELPMNWQWRVVGDGNDRPFLELEVNRLGLNTWVKFLGDLSDSELIEEIRGCSCLLMPSKYAVEADGKACGEGFGIVYLEAAQAGRPSIACRIGGQTDLIIDGVTGWLIEPEEKALSELLQALASDNERLTKAGIQAREQAVKYFNTERFEAELLTLLQSRPH